jgi:hypothetical protein
VLPTIAAWVLLAPGFAACLDVEPSCTLSVEPAIHVEVRDAVTNDFLTVTPRGVAREDAFEDSLRVAGMTPESPQRVTSMIAADERMGTYVVRVEADGYQPWDTSGVAASRGSCHVVTQQFTASLQPE